MINLHMSISRETNKMDGGWVDETSVVVTSEAGGDMILNEGSFSYQTTEQALLSLLEELGYKVTIQETYPL